MHRSLVKSDAFLHSVIIDTFSLTSSLPPLKLEESSPCKGHQPTNVSDKPVYQDLIQITEGPGKPRVYMSAKTCT